MAVKSLAKKTSAHQGEVTMFFRLSCVCFSAAGLLLAGCGDSGIKIHGKISVNGAPLEEAEIQFVPMNSIGGDQLGTTVIKGAYTLVDSERLKEGEYQVQIRAYRGTGKKIWDGMGDGKNKNMVDDLKQFVPPKYNDASELKVAIKPGNNEFNSDLQIPNK